jgi:PPP family 3-phenylpropionic acid transporter
MIYFAMSLHILGYGLFAGISVIYVNETIAVQDQTRGQALMTMTVTLGAVIGSLLGGSLIDRIQVPGMLLVSGVIALIGTIIVSIFARKTGGH